MADPILSIQNLSVRAGDRLLLQGITAEITPGHVIGVIGPSGAGKSTLLRCINRMVDLSPGLQVSGQILFHDQPIYSPATDPDQLRERIGILFQQPVVFPKSIYQNVLFGIKHLARIPKRDLPALAEAVLRETSLWDEVKDRLHEPAIKLSVGQQQRLCLARTLATRPEVLLMDEPTSALDPASTEAIESLILRLRAKHTILLVTHNHAQATRICDRVLTLTVQDGVGRLKH